MPQETALERLFRASRELTARDNQFVDGEFEFDPFLRLAPEQEDRVYAALGPIARAKKLNKITTAQAELLPRRISMLVANGMHALQQGLPAFHPKGKKHFAISRVGHPPYAGRQPLLDLIDAFEAEGLLKCAKAPNHPGYGKSSTLIGTAKLAGRLLELGIETPALDYCISERPALELRDSTKTPIHFEWGSEQERMARLVRRHNEFMLEQSILLPGLNGASDQKFTGILKRVFSNSSWEQNGRFHSPYQLLKSRTEKERERLLINGCATVEPDYSGFQPRLLYHLLGTEYTEDPYHIPGLIEAADGELSHATLRAIAKFAMVIAINRSDSDGLGKHWEKFELIAGRRLNLRAVFDLCVTHHYPVHSLLYKGTGMKLMNIESNICHRVLEMALAEGIVILPVHDSFICQPQHEHWVKRSMIQCYYEEVRFYPVIGN